MQVFLPQRLLVLANGNNNVETKRIKWNTRI